MSLVSNICLAIKRFRHNLLAWNSRGEGIHSPYLFELVRFALHDVDEYYCWQQLRPSPAEKVVFRLLNFLHQKHGGPLAITVMQEDRYARPKYRLAKMAQAVDAHNDVHIEKGTRVRESLFVDLDDKSVMVVTDIHVDRESEEYWQGIQRRKDVYTTMDFFDIGLVFYDPCYLRRNYMMKL